MPNRKHIDRIVLKDAHGKRPAECTIYYKDCNEPCQLVFPIDDVHNGHTIFWFETDNEGFESTSHGVIVALNADNLIRVSKWFNRNTPISIPLPT